MSAQDVAAQVAEQIRMLASDKIAEREAAFKKLVAIGEPAIPALREAFANPEAEISTRARELVATIEVQIASDALLAMSKRILPAKTVRLGITFSWERRRSAASGNVLRKRHERLRRGPPPPIPR